MLYRLSVEVGAPLPLQAVVHLEKPLLVSGSTVGHVSLTEDWLATVCLAPPLLTARDSCSAMPCRNAPEWRTLEVTTSMY